jgi:putative transposase
MAHRQRTGITTATQSILTDNPDFLRLIVERVVQEILAVAVADTGSAATYHHLFGDLKARGLNGVRLVTSDSQAGLKTAIDRHFQGASWNRCQVHFSRDLVGMVGAGRRGELAADLREIFAATTREQALTVAEAVAARWESPQQAVARLLEEGARTV